MTECRNVRKRFLYKDLFNLEVLRYVSKELKTDKELGAKDFDED